jgi:hypothetical protein
MESLIGEGTQTSFSGVNQSSKETIQKQNYLNIIILQPNL